MVQEAVSALGSLFPNEPSRRHFGEYLTGLFIAERKTVKGINSEFVVTTDQSCLNRWLTGETWDPAELNRARLQWLQEEPSTRYAASGVIAVDNVLVDHAGKMIEDAGYFWDHAEARNKIAQDYLIANYVCPSGKHYALDFRRFRKRAQCEPETFRDHTALFIDLAEWICAEGIPGDFTFDSYFTNAAILNFLNGRGRGYVGDLKFNRKVWMEGTEMSASDMASRIPPSARVRVEIDDNRQWGFTKKIRLPNVDHAVRIVILWKERNDAEPAKILLTNKTYWEITRTVRTYRRRWTGTETFHRDGKQHLGMGDCQLRSGEGQTRHLHLVILAHSLLVRRMRTCRLSDKLTLLASTIGEACRRLLRETLGRTIAWSLEKARQGWSADQITQTLGLLAK